MTHRERLEDADKYLDRLEHARYRLKQLDKEVSDLANDMNVSNGGIFVGALSDAADHAQQIHFRLTECKGHIGAIASSLKTVQDQLKKT